MRVCIVSSSTDPHTGLGRVVLSVAGGLSKRGHSVGIVGPREELTYDFCAVALDTRWQHPIKLINSIVRMRAFFHSYDIIVAFDVRPAGILTHLACIGLGKHIIIHVLGTYGLFTQKNVIKNLLMRWVYAKSEKVLVINTFVRRCVEASGRGFVFGHNLLIVPIGVDTALFSPNPHPTFKYARSYIISVGALKMRKGQLKSIQAFIRIADTFPNFHYVIVGDQDESSSYVREIRKTIEDAHLSHRIHLIQRVSDIELIDLYSGAQFFVLTPVTTPNAIEGFGMVYIEAALCGLPALGTAHTGAEMAIEHERSGLLVEGSIESISNGMRRLLMNDAERKSYGMYARGQALLFDWSHVIDKYEKEIAEFIT